ncbi:MAG: hypothetical protein OEZ06_28100 [Myxococcales bacterium]|nr:hypothetical protein [Myxococcales bacterium]
MARRLSTMPFVGCYFVVAWMLGAAAGAGGAAAQQPTAEPVEPAAQGAAGEAAGVAVDGVRSPPSAEPAAQSAAVSSPEDLYHLAFAALAQERTELALALLQQLRTEHPDHPLARRAAELAAHLATRPLAPPASAPAATGAYVPSAQPGDPTRERAPEPAPIAEAEADGVGAEQRPTGAARAELMFFQTVHGIALGAETCAILGCDGPRSWTAALMLGGGLGLSASYLASREGITPSMARALTDGVIWGAANGLMLMSATDALSGSTDEGLVIGGHFMGGQLLGLAASAYLHYELQPTTGQVSLTSSGGLWALALSAQFMAMLDQNFTDETWGWTLLLASDAGLLAGGILASYQPMSASRVLLIDAGGVLGGLTGMGLSLLLQDRARETPTFGGGVLGTASGLVLGYVLTAGWDRSERGTGVRLSLQPTQGGAAVGLGGAF